MTNLSSLAGFSTGGASGSNPDFFANDGALADSALVDTAVSGYSNGTGHATYMGVFPAATSTGNIKDRNIFGIWRQWTDTSQSTSGFSITSFEVNKTTGAITVLHGGAQPVWTNSSGAAMSTTNLHYDPNFGCFFSGGHNAYPGHSTHYFGYTAGQLDSTGAVQGTSNSATNADHGYNGTFCACLQQGSTNYFMSAGYSSSYAAYRIHQATSSGITVGNLQQPGTWTSSSSAWVAVNQPDITSPQAGETVTATGMSFNNPNYGWAFVKQGTSSAATRYLENGYQKGALYPGYNGTKTLLEQQQDYGTLDASNNFTSLADGVRDLDYQLTDPGAMSLHGIGNNKFLYTGTGSLSKGFDLFKLDSNNNPVHLQTFRTSSGGASILDNPASGYTSTFLVYENSSDANPKWLVSVTHAANLTIGVRTQEITADFTQYN